MNKAKLVAFDLDGTLLRNDGRLSKRNKKALQDLYEHGNQLLICSGKPIIMTRPYVKEIGVPCWVACCNGAFIEDSNENSLYQKQIPEDVLKRLVTFLRKEKIDIIVLTQDGIYRTKVKDSMLSQRANAASELARKHHIPLSEPKLYREPFDTKKHNPYKVVVRKKEDHDYNMRLYKTLLEEKDIMVTSSDEVMFDVSAKGVSKGNAIRIVAKHLNIPMEQTYAFGDYYNDLDMFETVACSIAMGNAPKDVKAKATYAIDKTNQEDGVAYAIETILLKD